MTKPMMPDTIVRSSPDPVSGDIQRLIEGTLHDPFCVLGRQHTPVTLIRAFIPHASKVYIHKPTLVMRRLQDTDIFEYRGRVELPAHYRLHWRYNKGKTITAIDPYSFTHQISDLDLHLISEGKHQQLYQILGAHHRQVDGITGVLFATWAPNAQRVSITGDFNDWNGRSHPMRCRGSTGIWELFIPELEAGMRYKFEIRNRNSEKVVHKTDIYAREFELRPKTASVIGSPSPYPWRDQSWLAAHSNRDWISQPMSIYEMHVGSWRRHKDGRWLNYRELAEQLVPYVKSLGFNYVEIMPITEHPFDASWGYQTTGYFAPTCRYGSADDFCYFVDYCHQHGIGVLLDWVVSHFPRDEYALSQYDGSALYEHADPQKGEHRDWGTLIFNYGRNEVKNFLISNALFWLDEFHLDGLRVDAVASMLYLDYSREPGDWCPNRYGGNENLEAVSFLRELNEVIHSQLPGKIIIAEESTSWPQVSRPTYLGGLGFSMKWNMGWMHDTLEYMGQNPVHRRYHHAKLTFGMLYAYSENFVLALSHDEVVHGKASLLHKMPGDDWQKFANLRLLYTYLFTYPGKKLLFMGGEFGQRSEWDHDTELEWQLLKYAPHRGLQKLVADLNRLYQKDRALHCGDFSEDGFQWINCHDSDQSVLSYLRRAQSQQVVVVLNFTPVPRYKYRLGVPAALAYREQLNSDSALYDGGNVGNWGEVKVEPIAWMGYAQSIELTLPPLGGLILVACP